VSLNKVYTISVFLANISSFNYSYSNTQVNFVNSAAKWAIVSCSCSWKLFLEAVLGNQKEWFVIRRIMSKLKCYCFCYSVLKSILHFMMTLPVWS